MFGSRATHGATLDAQRATRDGQRRDSDSDSDSDPDPEPTRQGRCSCMLDYWSKKTLATGASVNLFKSAVVCSGPSEVIPAPGTFTICQICVASLRLPCSFIRRPIGLL